MAEANGPFDDSVCPIANSLGGLREGIAVIEVCLATKGSFL
jgi:hypothetical protein